MKKLQLKELLKHIIQEVKSNLDEDSVNVTKDPQLKVGTDIPMGAVNVEEERTLGVPEQHQKRIAIQTLKMHDAAVGVMGGMDKDEAREFLKSIGWSDAKINQVENGDVKMNEVLTPATINRARIFAGAALRWAVDPTAASSALKRLAFKVSKPDLRKDYELAAQYVLDPKMAKTLQEMSTTGGVAGYATPYAFSKKGSGAKRALDVTKKMGMKVVGEAPRV